MAIGNAADIGYGLAITLSSSVFAQITDFSHDGFGERSVIDISSNISTNAWRIFLPGDLKSAGTLTVECNLLTNNLSGYKTLVGASKATGTVTYPVPVDGGASAGTIAADAFCSSFSIAAPMDDRLSFSCTVQLSGEPTMTNAA